MISQWFDNHSNVMCLAKWLKERGEWNNFGQKELPNGKIVNDDPIDRLICFFEKPWKFDDEWEEYQNSLMKG